MKIDQIKHISQCSKPTLPSKNELILELNNYLSFYILKDRIQMKEFFKSIRKIILSRRCLSAKQFETLLPYLTKEPDLVRLGSNNVDLVRQRVIERYTALVETAETLRVGATLDQFLQSDLNTFNRGVTI